MNGTGEGQKVKGHKWERTMNATLEKRRKAMEEMPEMIRLWKQVRNIIFIFPFSSFFSNSANVLTQLNTAWSRTRLEEVSQIREQYYFYQS